MRKKLLSLITASAVIISTLLTGCSSGQDGEKTDTPASSTSVTSPDDSHQTGDGTSAPEESGKPEEGTGTVQEEGNPADDITAAAIANVIKTAYGENYLPDTQMDGERISTLLGISAEDCADIYAESPMIGTHPDTLIIVKPAEGKFEEVKSKLEAYREKLINDTMQYPMNLAKINASKVITGGDYVAFILLGALNENEDASEEEQAQFAEAQEKIGVDAFSSCFKAIEHRA